MKRLIFISALMLVCIVGKSQYLPLSTLLTYFETGDKPTEAQFIAAWANSYNGVADGMWDLTGYPSIAFTPYSTLQVGKFYQGAAWPTDTTTRLVYNGTLVLPNLWVNGQRWTGTGSSAWTLLGSTLYPTDTASNIAINSTTAQGYDLFINGNTFSSNSIRTTTSYLQNSLGDEAILSIDAFGNLQFTDENNTAITLSSLAGSAAWNKVLGQISPVTITDTISIGAASGDSLFNVYGTSYFEDQAFFDSALFVSGILSTNRYVETPSVNLNYGGYSGRIDLYTALGLMKFYDSENPTGVTLTQLKSGEFVRSGSLLRTLNATDNLVVGGTTASSTYDLSVIGATSLAGNTTIGGGLTMTYGTKIQFSNGFVTNDSRGIVFNDVFAGEISLNELKGVYNDSMSVSRLNVDTMYFNDVVTKSLYSPKNNNIYAKINSEEWRFEEFEAGSTDYGVFHSNSFLYSALIPDATQSTGGFASRGRMYLSSADTTFKYFTGKTGEWRALADKAWVTNAISGGIGLVPSFDTIYFSPTAYMTNVNQSFKFASTAASGDTLDFNVGAATYIASSKGSSIEFYTDSLRFNLGAAVYTYDGTYWKNPTDTLSTRAYARLSGGGGTAGNPGGSANDLQFNNAGSFGGFWAYDGTNIVPTTATGLAWSATSFIKGHTADSVIMGRTASITNAYAAETGQKNNFKSLQAYAGGNLNSLSNVYTNYNDANANNGLAYGVYSHLYVDENYAASGNTSYSNAGRFILQNRGTTTIGGGSPGTLYMNGVYGEITGTINADATPGTYILAAIYGKSNYTGTATGYAGYFDGIVKISGTFITDNGFTLGDGGEAGSINTSDWDITTTGVMTGITGITNDAAITSTGGIVSLNASSNFAINLATGTSTGAVSIGGGSNTVAVNSTSWDISTAGAVSGLTTLSMSGQLTNTLATGTSPFAVTSTTLNTNLNADLLDGQTGSYYQSATNITAGTLPGDRGVTSGSASSSFVEYNGTTPTSGQWDGSTTLPTGTTRQNYGGYLYATRHYGDFYIPRLAALTDTLVAVIYPGGLIDSAQQVISASRGWEIELEDFDTYYSKAEQLKALPLPYPDGTERRKPNAMYANYQFEFELERLTRYLKQTRDENKALRERIDALETKKIAIE